MSHYTGSKLKREGYFNKESKNYVSSKRLVKLKFIHQIAKQKGNRSLNLRFPSEEAKHIMWHDLDKKKEKEIKTLLNRNRQVRYQIKKIK